MAIAAVLALSSTCGATSAIAQTAPASTDTPAVQAAPAPAATPTIVLPPLSAEPALAPVQPAPAVQASTTTVPEAVTAEVPARPAAAAGTPSHSRRVVPRAAAPAAPAAPARVSQSPRAAPAAMAPIAPAAVSQPPPRAASTPMATPARTIARTPAPTRDTESGWPIGLAALAALGLAGGGLALARSRRRPEPVGDDLADDDVTVEPATFRTEEAEVPTEAAPVIATSDFVDDPEQAAQIEEMVAAPPDAANPFRTRKARRRRARALLAQRPAVQPEQPMARGFDWRTYVPTGKQKERETVA